MHHDRQATESASSPGYRTARGVGKLIAFLGWIGFVLGAIFFLGVLLRGGPGAFMIVPAIALAVGGLLLIVQGQILQAIVDVASDMRTLVSLVRERPARLEPDSSRS